MNTIGPPEELQKDIDDFMIKLKEHGCLYVIGIVPKTKNGIFIMGHRTSRDIAMILNAILLNIDDKVVSAIKDLYDYFKGKK